VSDNPFEQPDDSDATVFKPTPGGRRPASRPAAPPIVRTAQPDNLSDPLGGGDTEAVLSGRAGILSVTPSSPTTSADVPVGGPGLSPLVAAANPLLQLVARLRNTAHNPDVAELRERVVREVRAFERRARDAGVPDEQVAPANYALCAAIDDVVLNTPWGAAGVWESNSLVATFHRQRRSGQGFFEVLAEMRQYPGKFLPVLEVMYLCLSLGFLGQARFSPRGPAEIDKLREETYALIMRNRAGPEQELAPHWQGVAAPYHPSRPHLPVWVAGAGALALLAGLYVWMTNDLNAASDDLYARMLAVPPQRMPEIVRAAPVTPPAQPPPDQPTTVDKLRQFLKPEIDQGLVAVLGTPSAPLIRILNQSMFPSGSATLETRSAPLLERIGTALKAEAGSVLVAGYTDNEPIRTVRFPSNFQLSASRAQAASAVIAHTIGDPARLSTEGRADADPIASNATPQGREQNRRIEITLRRSG
jgi:type VI secretion system protein ImpK